MKRFLLSALAILALGVGIASADLLTNGKVMLSADRTTYIEWDGTDMNFVIGGTEVSSMGSGGLTAGTLVVNDVDATADEINAVADRSTRLVDITAASDAVTAAEHCDRIVTLSVSGGSDLTLPAATGTGCVYTFIVATATTDAYTWTRAGSDTIAGQALCDDGDGEPANGWTASAATVITMGGTAQASGGSVGDKIVLVDYGSATWQATITCTQGGTEVTPFS